MKDDMPSWKNNMPDYEKYYLMELRKTYMKKIAEEICSVQPMPSDLFENLMKDAKSEEELIKEGYKRVSRLGLLWIKDD
jgi:3-methyladenine DNA glycosylase AlkD